MGEKAHYNPSFFVRAEEQENPATDEDGANPRIWKKRY
jgi:hypothetical protein